MLRRALFAAVLGGGTVILQSMEVLPRDEAWLVSGAFAALVLFAIPLENQKREPKELVILLLATIVFYGILLKFRPWLATIIDPRIAIAISILIMLLFIVAVFAPNIRGTKSKTPNAG